MDGPRFSLATGRPPNQQQRSVAQEAKEAREARARARAHEASVLRLQRAWRRRLGRTRVRRELEEDLDKKLRDVAALRQLVEGTKGLPFCPPLPASLRLVRQLLFCHRINASSSEGEGEGEAAVRVARLCSCILIPHLRQSNPCPLLQALAADPQLLLVPRLLDVLLSYAGAIDYTGAKVVSQSGADGASLVVVLPTIGQLCVAASSASSGVQLDWPSTFWPALRAICVRHEVAFFTPSKRGPSTTWLASPGFQALFQLIQVLLQQYVSVSSAAVLGYITWLLTVPSLAAHIKHDAAVLPALLEAWGAVVTACPDDALPPSPSPAASSLVWLLSNAATILHAALLAPSPAAGGASAAASVRALLLERRGLASITGLLVEAPAGIVSEQGLISLLTQGNSTTTLCVDAQVTAAARLLFHEDFVRRLAATTLLRADAEEETASPLKARQAGRDGRLALERPEDRSCVSRAAALDLTFKAHEAHRAQREAPLLTRVARRVGGLFGGFGWGGGGGGHHRGEEEEGSGEEADGEAVDEEQQHLGGGDGLEGSLAAVVAVEQAGLAPLVDFLATTLWKCHAAETAPGASTSSSLGNPTKRSILSTLVFPQGGAAIRRLWLHLLTHHGADLQRAHKFSLAAYASPDDCGSARGFLSSLALLAGLLQHQLLVLSDEELRAGVPLPIPHLIRLIRLLQRMAFHGCVGFAAADEASQGGGSKGAPAPFGKFLLASFCQLLRRLFDRWSRRAFCVAEVWGLANDAESRRAQRAVREQTGLGRLLLATTPFAVPFPERLDLFRAWAAAEKRAFQSPDLPPIFVKIRRTYILEDGLGMLEKLRGTTSLRRRVIIVFVSQTGAQESGVDSGGLLREFISEVSARAFAPDFGLFTRTPDGLLYPNPSSQLAHPGSDHLRLFELVGTLLGKAIFEGIVIEALFAPFFLGALRGRQQFFHVLDDLRQLDAEMHKHLGYLRGCQDDVEALGLTFTITSNAFGEQEEVELVPGGRDMPVTAANRFAYIQLVARHIIVDRIAPQTQAFVRGFHAVVPAAALQAFSEPELQILVSGSLAGIDVADMRRHAQYAGGYTGFDRHVRRLWEAVGGFSQEELSLFLQFVTSSRRAPTGGFGSLRPPLTIVRVPIRRDDERLPVGRTCFNQLMWPTYKSVKVAREKLLYAISAQAGFELT